jgi:hypothetical protein
MLVRSNEEILKDEVMEDDEMMINSNINGNRALLKAIFDFSIFLELEKPRSENEQSQDRQSKHLWNDKELGQTSGSRAEQMPVQQKDCAKAYDTKNKRAICQDL